MAKVESNNGNWGGARQNAGRPKLTNGDSLVRAVTLTESRLHFMLNKYGNRKLSEGLRSLIDLDMLANDYSIDLEVLLTAAIKQQAVSPVSESE